MKPEFSIVPERRPEPRTERKGFSKRERAEAFMRAGGRCEACNAKVTGKYEVDHRIALDHTGKHEPGNWRVLCVDSHKVKTAKDIGISAHINRIHVKHGFTDPKRKPRPKMKGAGFQDRTRKFDGSIGPKQSAARRISEVTE